MTICPPDNQCVICSRHSAGEDGTCSDRCEPKARADGLLVCDWCRRRMDAALADLPDLCALANDELLPGRTGSSGTSGEVSIGIRIDALDMTADVLGVLATWQRDWTETLHGREVDWTGGDVRRPGLDRQVRDVNVPNLLRTSSKGEIPTLTSIVEWLRANLLKACAEHPAIDEFSREVGRLWGAASSASRSQPRQSWVVDCPADTDDGVCGARLRVNGSDFDRMEDGRSVPKVVPCPDCGSHWQIDRLLLVVHSTKDAQVWLPAEEVALLMAISESTLRRLARDYPTVVLKDRGRYELASVRAALTAKVSDASGMVGA